MKKMLLLIVFLLNININYSQNEKIKKVEIGINVGLNSMKTRGENQEFTKLKIGNLFGVNFEYHLSEKISLKSNLNFERKNIGNINAFFGEYGVPTNFDAKLDYLTLPILLNYNFGKSSNLFVNGGFFVGYLLNAKSKYKNIFTSPNFDVISDITPIYKKTDIGLSLGIGTKIKINNSNSINIEIRDNLGLKNISELNHNPSENIKTNSLNLILIWNFNLKKRLPTLINEILY